MKVRLQLRYGRAVEKTRSFNRQLAVALASILTPGSVMAMVLGFWRLGADLNLTGAFAISGGIFSHWQVWLALGFVMQGIAIVLGKFGHRDQYGSDDATV